MKQLKSLKKTLGPGILFASTAIGVSHLVQSTKAGALFGFGLLWALLAANILKYPFFEFSSSALCAAQKRQHGEGQDRARYVRHPWLKNIFKTNVCKRYTIWMKIISKRFILLSKSSYKSFTQRLREI